MEGLQMKYFVVSPNKDDAYGQASREALLAYASAIEAENPHLCSDLRRWVHRASTDIERRK